MKYLSQLHVIVSVAILLTVTGCASSGGSTESTAAAGTEISTDSVRVAESDAVPADSVTTAAADSVSSPEEAGAPATISGSTEDIRPARRDANTIEVGGDSSEELNNYLRRVPGVFVIGIGAGARISIRGLMNKNPLFVVDGMRWGHDYREIYEHIQLTEVKSIRVLKGVEASMYGMDGANGVIIFNLYGPREPHPSN